MKPILNSVTTIARKAGKIILQAQNDLSSIKISQSLITQLYQILILLLRTLLLIISKNQALMTTS